VKTYPPGRVTRRGIEILKSRLEPLVLYVSPDRTIQWCLSGGLEPQLGVQEGVALVDGVAGLTPTFRLIDSKGARQHGVTYQRTVYDPAEYDLQVEVTVPPNPVQPELAASAIRRVLREWRDSFSPERTGELVYVTPDMGRWVARVRLSKTPPEREFRAQARRLRQRYTWTVRNDDGFWRGTDSVSVFKFSYNYRRDSFRRADDFDSLGPQWKQTYIGDGTSKFGVKDGRAMFFPGSGEVEVRNRLLGLNEVQVIGFNGEYEGGTWTFTVDNVTTDPIDFDASAEDVQAAIEDLPNVGEGNVEVTGPNGGPWRVTFLGDLAFQNISTSADGSNLTPDGTQGSVTVATNTDGSPGVTGTDNQVITINLGDIWEWPFPHNGFLRIWGRMDDNDDAPTAVCATIERHWVTLSRFNSGVETVMKRVPLLVPPQWWEDWTLVCGTPTNQRKFEVKRGRFTRLSYVEQGTGSVIGASNRGVGFGARVGTRELIGGQAIPPSVDAFEAGDNVSVTQKGFVTVTNFGDIEGYPRYLVYGPGTFRIANGPGSSEFVEFGPLGENQIALLTTLPRLRGVVDLSPDQPEQELSAVQNFIDKLISFATNNNVPPLLEWFESLFGILPPQGEMYHLLKGRFTNPVPPKPSGEPPTPAKIAVEIVNGTAESKIVAALTPLRTWPE